MIEVLEGTDLRFGEIILSDGVGAAPNSRGNYVQQSAFVPAPAVVGPTVIADFVLVEPRLPLETVNFEHASVITALPLNWVDTWRRKFIHPLTFEYGAAGPLSEGRVSVIVP